MKILRSEKERPRKVYLPDLQSVHPQDRNRNFFSGKKSVNFFHFFSIFIFLLEILIVQRRARSGSV